MTVKELIDQLVTLDAPGAEVQVVVKEPYDDDAQVLSDDVGTVVFEKSIAAGRVISRVLLKGLGVDE
jgi:hypothetical protein